MNTPEDWPKILAAGVQAQRLVPGCVAVGGTAAALHAKHRVSYDTDHVLAQLREHFDNILAALESHPTWKTARVNKPVLILGSVDGIQVGYRQQIRSQPMETQTVGTPHGPLVIPTLDEMVGMKAWLAYRRNTTRDFLDFAALAQTAGEPSALASLLRLDERYGDKQSRSVALAVAQALSDPRPYDLAETSLANYKGLRPEWHEWLRTQSICQHLGLRLGEALIAGDTNQ